MVRSCLFERPPPKVSYGGQAVPEAGGQSRTAQRSNLEDNSSALDVTFPVLGSFQQPAILFFIEKILFRCSNVWKGIGELRRKAYPIGSEPR